MEIDNQDAHSPLTATKDRLSQEALSGSQRWLRAITLPARVPGAALKALVGSRALKSTASTRAEGTRTRNAVDGT